jgi:hypothetical protein
MNRRKVVSGQWLVASEGRSRNISSAFRLPPSPLRKGVSLLEVLISIGVLSVGLLSILMIIPLGQMTIAESIKADRAGACGRAVMRDIKVKRMLDYRSWWWGYINPTNNLPVTELWGWGWTDSLAGPKQTKRDRVQIDDPVTGVYAPYPDAIGSFVIDPLGISKGLPDIFYLYPASLRRGQPYSITLSVPPPPASMTPLPILPRRSLSATYLNAGAARNPINGTAFIWPDDVAFDTPENGTERPFINSAGLDNNRSWDYSYLLTVSPSSSEPGLPLIQRRLFDVTVVVFFQRNFNLSQNASTNLAGFPEGEWMSEVLDISGMGPNTVSPGGGTITLGNAGRVKGNATNGQQLLPFSPSQLPGVRQNQWVMLWDSIYGRLAWYRVTGVNFPDTPTAANPATLTLDGPDWIVTNSTKLLVIDGAIGAYTSTVELDFDPLWQGMQ